MKRKRLDRDVWWAFNKIKWPRYYQMRVDIEDFHGLVCLIKLCDVSDEQHQYWDFPQSGKKAIIGKDMVWLQLIPDRKKHVITAMYLPDNSLSVCYVDVIENMEYDADGVAVFIDKYLDVVFTTQGDVIIADRDELDEALESGDISKEQYDSALIECDLIISELCSDIAKTNKRLAKILNYVNDKTDKEANLFTGR